jgi:SAM-dependent methyltransferase
MPKAQLTRQFYDRSPYPPPRHARARRWRLAPLDWILSIDRDRKSIPGRVLVAGCGTGSEAFMLQDALPKAEIVAVDFSSNSIRIARQTQAKSSPRKRIHFIKADLTQPDLQAVVGGEFDLVVCHGVLSYIPEPAVALGNLAQCLRPDGLFYLGVNGAAHFSASLRPVLARLGIDVAILPTDACWRPIVQMWEAVDGGAKAGPLTLLPDWYLGSDFFGPVLHNLRLDQWADLFRQAGLFLCASHGAHRTLRPMIASAATALMMPRSRAEVCELLDLMHPAGFHRLVLTRQPTAHPPWENRGKLLSWRPAPTGLYRASSRRQAKRSGDLPVILLKSSVLDTKFEWPMPRWEREVLRRCDGVKPLGQILDEIGEGASAAGVCEQLFLLYQFGVINVFTPKAEG